MSAKTRAKRYSVVRVIVGKGTMIAIGVGALAAAGGIAAPTLTGDEGDGDDLEPTGQCNETIEEGSDSPETHVIELGKRSGTFLFEYQTYTIRDRMVIEYRGDVLFDTGCVGTIGWWSRYISYSGKSSKVTVYVTPNCAGEYNTRWHFIVYCPY